MITRRYDNFIRNLDKLGKWPALGPVMSVPDVFLDVNTVSFIAAQLPLPGTVWDFLRTEPLLHLRVYVVVLTRILLTRFRPLAPFEQKEKRKQ